MLGFQTRTSALLTCGASLGLSGKEAACQCRGRKFHPWVRKIPGKGNGNPLQYSCLGNPMDRGAWWATVHGAAKEMDMTERLNSNCSYLRRIIIGWGRILCVADAWQRLCLHLLDSRNNPRCHRRTNKKCLQRLPNAPRRPKSCPV